MKRAIFVSAAAVAALAACGDNTDDTSTMAEPNSGVVDTESSDQNPEPGPDQPEPDRDNLEFNQEMAYYFSKGDRGPALSFGVPRTDNIALSLRCPPGAMGKTVWVSFNRPAEVVAQRPDTITLKVGDVEQQLATDTRDTQLGTTVEVTTNPDAPVLRAYRQGTALTVIYGEETIVIPSRDSDTEIDEFFGACSA